MKRSVIILLIGLVLLGSWVATICKYVPMLNREIVVYCEECYDHDENNDDIERVIMDEGVVMCEHGAFNKAGEVLYTNRHRVERDNDRYGKLIERSWYLCAAGMVIAFIGVLGITKHGSGKGSR